MKKLALRRLKSEDFFSNEATAYMLDMVPASIVIHDLKGHIVYANAQACRIHCTSRNEFLGKCIQDFTIGDSMRLVKSRLKLAGKKRASFEVKHRRKDGTIGNLLVTVWPVLFSKARLLVSVASDITERNKMENDLKYSEARFRDMCDFLPQVIYEADLAGKLTYVNRRALDVYGYTSEEFAAGMSLFSALAPEDVPRARDAVRRILAGEVSQGNEYIAVRKDGTRIPILVSSGPMKRDGVVFGIRGVFTDMTEHKLAEAQKLELEKHMQLTEKIDSLGVLAGGIAHDFNNLLGGLYGYLEMALDHCKPEDKIATLLRKAEISFERAKDLTLQLLTFAKGGAPVMSTGSLAPLLRDNTKFALSGSNVTCSFHIPRDLRLCDFDKNQIGQVIDNLVINACQAMPDGGRLIVTAKNVTVKTGGASPEKKDFIKISFKDTGPGVPAEALPKIFDPFFTTKKKGTGLGLTTVYSIIKKHGGEISVESPSGKGATFQILLPGSNKMESAERVAPTARHKGTGRVLVMDDETAMREILGAMLSSMGYEVTYAIDGWEALDLASDAIRRHKPFTAVFMDLTIPGGMGGRETIGQLRQIDPGVPAFVVSGYSENPVMSDPARYGFVGKLQKPFRKSELSEVLNNYLSRAKTGEPPHR
jgi:PAS domain S-box-containing protein